MMAGQAASFGPDAAAARKAAARIHHLLQTQPAPPTALRPLPAAVRGDIEFRNVCFSYPSRPGAEILRNFNLTVGASLTCICHPSCLTHFWVAHLPPSSFSPHNTLFPTLDPSHC
jgi:ABC-type multidrug transport system fused ATPase/permease subunit